MAVYEQARVYLSRAEALSVHAAGAVRAAIAGWELAQVDEQKAVVERKAARSAVAFYTEALAQLGVAEYTGVAMISAADIESQNREIDQTELATVAAAYTGGDLQRAQHTLAGAERRVLTAIAAVAADHAKTIQAKVLLVAANDQVTTSQRALVMAKQWATQPGEAPTRPLVALAMYEGKLGAGYSVPRRGGTGARYAATLKTVPTTALASSTKAGTGPRKLDKGRVDRQAKRRHRHRWRRRHAELSGVRKHPRYDRPGPAHTWRAVAVGHSNG